LPFEARQVERAKVRLIPTAEKLIELRPALIVKANDLAIERSFVLELGERGAQAWERFADVTISGDEVAAAGLNYGERSEPIVLKLEQPIRVVERLTPERQAHGRELRNHLSHFIVWHIQSAIISTMAHPLLLVLSLLVPPVALPLRDYFLRLFFSVGRQRAAYIRLVCCELPGFPSSCITLIARMRLNEFSFPLHRAPLRQS